MTGPFDLIEWKEGQEPKPVPCFKINYGDHLWQKGNLLRFACRFRGHTWGPWVDVFRTCRRCKGLQRKFTIEDYQAVTGVLLKDFATCSGLRAVSQEEK